jgi:hypothetical protein
MFSEDIPFRYRKIIDYLLGSQIKDIWMTGGTLLGVRLRLPYYGDLDLLVGAPSEFVEMGLSGLGLSIIRSPFGALRCTVEDGSHIDMVCNTNFSSTSQVQAFLEEYHFSCVSAAQNILTNELVCSSQNISDFKSRVFSFGCKYIRAKSDALPNLKRISAYQNYFGLTARDSKTSCYYRRERAAVARHFAMTTPVEQLEFANNELKKYLPQGCTYYLCRGYVRNALCRQLGIWDDLDVLVLASTKECEDHLVEIGVDYISNYFGMPKLKSNRGQKIDLICIGNRDPISFLNDFVINLDRIAWDSRNGTFVGEQSVMECIKNGVVDIDPQSLLNYPLQQRAYFHIKSVYFCALYDKNPSKRLEGAFRSPILISEFDMSNAFKLAIELLDRLPQSRIARFLNDSEGCVHDSPMGALAYFVRAAAGFDSN